MALITRFARLFTADVHAVLDRIEEPEVVLKQCLREMSDAHERGEQLARALDADLLQLESRATDLVDTIEAMDGELDLCFEANEEALARSLVRRKLAAQQAHKQTRQRVEGVSRERTTLSETLDEQSRQLAELRQKAELVVDAHDGVDMGSVEAGVTQDAVDVAFLREKQRRRS